MQSGVEEKIAGLKNNLSELRGERSVQDVAAAVGVTRKTIYDAENGETIPQKNTLAALIAYYRKPVVYDLPEIP